MRNIENRGSLMRAVAVALASGGRVNVGQGSFPFRGEQPRGAGRNGRHNVGNGCGTGAGVGLGYPPGCGPGTPLPGIPVGADGCPQGWLQCRQELAVTSLAVAATTAATITVTPRRVATPFQFYYHGAANSFVINSVRVDGVEYIGTDAGGVNADRWNATVTDHTFVAGQFSSTTPLTMVVFNLTAGALDFRGTLSVVASRG